MFDFSTSHFLIPDLLLLIFPFIVIGSRLFCNAQSKMPWRIANFGFIAIFILLNFIPLASGEGRFFISNWRIDDFGVLMREVLLVSAILGMWFAKDYFEHGADGKPQMHQIAEFIGAIAFATFGGVTVVSACDMLTFFLGLEIATIPMYALTAWNKKDQLGSEAATKYILMGSVAPLSNYSDSATSTVSQALSTLARSRPPWHLAQARSFGLPYSSSSAESDSSSRCSPSTPGPRTSTKARRLPSQQSFPSPRRQPPSHSSWCSFSAPSPPSKNK